MAFSQWFDDQQQPSNVALSDLCTHLTGRSNTEGRMLPLYDGEEEIDSESSRRFCGLCHYDDWRNAYRLGFGVHNARFEGPPFSPPVSIRYRTTTSPRIYVLGYSCVVNSHSSAVAYCLHDPMVLSQYQPKRKSRRRRLKPLPRNGWHHPCSH